MAAVVRSGAAKQETSTMAYSLGKFIRHAKRFWIPSLQNHGPSALNTLRVLRAVSRSDGLLNRAGNGVAMATHRLLRFGLDHHSRQLFGARITHHHAPTAL